MTKKLNISTDGLKKYEPRPVCDEGQHKWVTNRPNFYERAKCGATPQVTRELGDGK